MSTTTNDEVQMKRARRAAAQARPRLPLAFRCVDLENSGPAFDAFEKMLAHSREIGFATFARHADWKPVARSMNYVTEPDKAGLRLQDDRCVRFYSSRHDGARVVYMVHSAIEFVFKAPAPGEASRTAKRMKQPGSPWH